MKKLKVHWRDVWKVSHAVCGMKIEDDNFVDSRPKRVTCKNCMKTESFKRFINRRKKRK